jgi:hypothetical protein
MLLLRCKEMRYSVEDCWLLGGQLRVLQAYSFTGLIFYNISYNSVSFHLKLYGTLNGRVENLVNVRQVWAISEESYPLAVSGLLVRYGEII